MITILRARQSGAAAAEAISYWEEWREDHRLLRVHHDWI
jgi:hypothetical protein